MAFTLPAIKAKLGTTNYYILSMKAQELIKNTTIPRDIEGWENLSVDERYQREINEPRVKKQIAPYLANDKDRFFGAIILAVQNFDEVNSFEPLSQFPNKFPRLYVEASEGMGFLTFQGGETFVPLDGQHRLRAIKYAISGKDNADKDISEIRKPASELANEDVTVILVNFDAKKSRQIFTKVNRYAKPTTTGQNIVTDDDDIIAVLSREITNGDIIKNSRLVKYTSNTLTASDGCFTTLSTIYNCNDEIIKAVFPQGNVSKTELPDKNTIALYREKVLSVWVQITESIEVFNDALTDPDDKAGGDEKRKEIRQHNLLGRPVVQECLFRAYLQLTMPPTNMSPNEACRNLDSLPWTITDKNIADVWNLLLWTGDSDGKMITKNRRLASRVIAYMAGAKLSEEEAEALLEDYLKLFPEGEKKGKQLPQRIVK